MFAFTRQSNAGSPCSCLSPRQVAYGAALVILLLDQGIKYWVHDFTPYGWRQSVTPFFNLVHVWNYGAAFSFLADAGGWQRVFFGAIALVVSVWIIWALRNPLPSRERWGYALILGGALGNGIDRVTRGYVVDFLDFYIGRWHWPAFNIADIGIVCGAGLLVWSAFQMRGGSNE